MASLEREIHCWLQQQIKPPARPEVTIGIGDDAAVLDASNRKLVVTTDTIADGTHFQTREHPLALIGRKSLAVNLSDIAAMGAKPVAAVLHWMLPRTFTMTEVKTLFGGIHELALKYNVSIVGGDTNVWDSPLVVGATTFGLLDDNQPGWRLNSASPGDAIYVSGQYGGSILGNHLSFEPAVKLASKLANLGVISAATDVSDSLSRDLHVMSTASNCGAEIVLADIPIADASFELSKRERSVASDGNAPEQQMNVRALKHALTDGEDFGLILAVRPADIETLEKHFPPGSELTRIGTFCQRKGLWGQNSDGGLEPILAEGYDH